MKSKPTKKPPLYLLIILMFSAIIGFVVYLQLSNGFYSPQHRSCSNVDLSIRACSTTQDVRFDFQNSRDSVTILVRLNGELVEEMEPRRSSSTRIGIFETYEIETSVRGYVCSKDKVILEHQNIPSC